jgi:hypothetical protein
MEIKRGSLNESVLLDIGEEKLDEVTEGEMGCEGMVSCAGGGGGMYEYSGETTGSAVHCDC